MVVCVCLSLMRAAAHNSLFFPGLTSVSAALSPAGFSGQGSCAQTQSSVTKPAKREHVGKQALPNTITSRQIMLGKVPSVNYFTRSIMCQNQCVSLGTVVNLIPLADTRRNGHRVQQKTCR